ncbi:hypothetical protein LTR08_007509 [Meristemomyces frigidus]|nr:hypothetical protein LTR08_007509 [Meristemomyces frigidus]
MSINITVTVAVPLETVMAIQSAASAAEAARAAISIGASANSAVVNALNDLPYELTPKCGSGSGASTTLNSAGTQQSKEPIDRINLHIQTLTTKALFTITVNREATIGDVGCAIWDKKGIPPDQQCIIHASKQLNSRYEDDDHDITNSRTIKEVGLTHGSVVLLVLKLRGS